MLPFRLKTMYMIAAALFISGLGWGLFSQSGADTTEQQAYVVLEVHGAIEIRHYPEAIMAVYETPGSAYGEVANPSFRRLARYIFGGNERNEQIAMTAPVHMTMDEKGSKMAFVMPAAYQMEALPTPLDPDVVLERSPEQMVAALRFGGWASDSKLKEKAGELATWLAAHGFETTGPWRYLGYNPPWRVVQRRNEVVFPVRKSDK